LTASLNNGLYSRLTYVTILIRQKVRQVKAAQNRSHHQQYYSGHGSPPFSMTLQGKKEQTELVHRTLTPTPIGHVNELNAINRIKRVAQFGSNKK
jgi:hypothetical protein